MTEPERHGSIQIAQDLDFQEKSWKIQRIAWKVMLGIVVAGLLGIFGSGPLASATTDATESGVTVKYERFIRAGGRHNLKLMITPAAMDGDSLLNVWISSDWLAGNLVLAITPQPRSETVRPDRSVYTFSVAEHASPVEIRFALESGQAGFRKWRGGVDGDASLSFTQLAYP